MASHRSGRVLTSPLQRALDTCRRAGFGTRAEISPDLLEWDYGTFEGLTTVEIRRELPGWSLWRDGCPSGELPDDVGRRADRIIQTMRLSGDDYVLFAHGHVLRVLTARWLGLSASEGRLFALDAASVCVLGWEREVAVIKHWNDDSHLQGLMVD
jgi:probable phosphoglycerate mutase